VPADGSDLGAPDRIAGALPRLPPVSADPVTRPVMVQRWRDVVFLHWRYQPAAVQELLPRGVMVDEFEGSAWVGLVPFRMEGLGLPGLAPLPLVGAFPEVNVRTYVHSGRRRGVWFFSLDIDRLLPTVVARAAYHLPYCYGRADHGRMGRLVTSRVERRWPGGRSRAATEIAVRTGAAVSPDDERVRFLTCRWGLISATRGGRLRYAAVDHPAWALHDAEVLHLEDGLLPAAGLPAPTGPPLALWSPGVEVRVGRPVRLR
jgi:uncharacterized protein